MIRAALAVAALLALPIAAGAEEISFPAEDGATLRAFHVPAASGVPRRPTVVALHGCGGLARPDQPLRLPAREADWAARLTALGHPMLFPDSFGSRGLGEACGRADHPMRSEARRAGDARAALAWVAGQPGEAPGGAFLIGWSHGGSTVLATLGGAPREGMLRGAIAFYPGCGATLTGSPDWAAPVPLLMLLGGADDWTPARRCVALAERAPARVELRLFAGAHHMFDHPTQAPRTRSLPNGQTVTFGADPAAREAAIAAVTGFLAAR
ncbi:dienelactone hydrolase family protein [Roseomonas sp. PWR1]|uniref:Dienelactone hydrolase family protein n=1 Tax=Roseomonas nitratireducens TaxID=2820810 RepID=A0ABS4AZ38_9PROT|nr:dienelactone hydrolase family protein [Neoroseomonas nitratireducens]MBP0466016.1 dienelactone hydrolase family protein [Neoroseomonas nitratireducens]